ncbi:hypothetical protein [Methylomonas rivi]|uniref:Uncharacterized protein n=1 Tax=Methylomonas rivi TaxID=2952226 RepID=A0ABT1U992_9GAMM|nr:hypothetical protein [Methylomonas sp. WSC-6]MCQ8129935.1 hypothetical protein [Methylomonas sp. WSC-6]
MSNMKFKVSSAANDAPPCVGSILSAHLMGLSVHLIGLQRSYDSLKESVYSSLVMQTRLKPYLDAVGLQVDTLLGSTGDDALASDPNAAAALHGNAYPDTDRQDVSSKSVRTSLQRVLLHCRPLHIRVRFCGEGGNWA